MSEKVLITGGRGYIGLPLCLEMQGGDKEWLSVDTGDREAWVRSVGGKSLTQPNMSIQNEKNFKQLNVADYASTLKFLRSFRPDVIVHLASQPSAPFSEKTIQHRIATQNCNISMMQNLLYGSKEAGLNPRFVVTTTTGIPGAPDQPIIEGPMPNMAGSSYHVSRGFDSSNMSLAARQWGFRCLELRTSIVFGTRACDSAGPVTRFDWDFYFGTALNRFCLRSKLGESITVYGKGEQKKPFISLEDCVESLFQAVSWPTEGHEIMNQTTLCVSIKELAEAVGGEIVHIPNPRVEKEEHQMVIHNEKFLKLLEYPSRNTFTGEVESIKKDINVLRLPKDWRRVFDGK